MERSLLGDILPTLIKMFLTVKGMFLIRRYITNYDKDVYNGKGSVTY